MPSLLEQQLRFAHTLTAPRAPADPRLEIYRHNVAANLRNALAATYLATCRIMGRPAFGAAVDAFAAASPPRSGDLNEYGDGFAAFLESHEPAAAMPYLGALARLEWALDEAARAADVAVRPEEVLFALMRHGGEDRSVRLLTHPSLLLLCLPYPAMRIWQAHLGGGLPSCLDLMPSREWLLVRREGRTPCVERLSPAEHAWLAALHEQATLDAATAHATGLSAEFDLAHALRTRIADGTITGAVPV